MITKSLNQELSRENKNLQPANDPVGDKQSTGAHQSTSTLKAGSNVPDQKPHSQSLIKEPLLQVTQLMERLKNLSKNDQHDISTALDSAEASHEVFYLCAILFLNHFKTDSGTMKDLDVAIDLGTRALQLLSDHALERPGYLFELGTFYQTRFKRVGKIEDITEAVELAEQAISLVPDKHSSKPRYFSGLGISYNIRFHRLDTLADMERSIECQEQAVRLTPDDSTERRARLNNLGSAYQSLFEQLGKLRIWTNQLVS
ncbi:hypothetical protein FRC12_015691 [Ceratobasidium sp. 428]|nr:hypothetical protein FRC12_015691 [Ceratobasidium sp. 428]